MTHNLIERCEEEFNDDEFITNKSFAEKYGLVGKGKINRISKKTLNYVRSLMNESERINQAGKDYVKMETRRFG